MLQRLPFVLIISVSILLFSSSGLLFEPPVVNAAEQVVLKYRIFREAISVKELSTFAETGELSTSLRINLALARQDPKAIRQYLTQPVRVKVVFLDRVLNSPVGNVILDQISQVIHTPSRQADRQALRSALILSASRDGQISLIETIQNYPTQQVEVEGDRLESAYRQLRRLEDRLEDLLDNLPKARPSSRIKE